MTRSAVIGAVTCTTLVSSALIGGIASPAFAAAPSSASAASGTASKAPRTLAAIQASAVAKTTDRTSSLNAAIAKVTANAYLTASDKSTILGVMNGDLAGMTTVAAKIAADTTVQTAATDYATIFTGYRVYAVALPQAHYSAAADNLSANAVPKLTAAQQKLAGLLSGADASKSTPALQADLADMSTQISKASTALDGLASGALAVTPAAYNSNHGIMSSFRSRLSIARTALKAAARDGKTIAAALR